MAWPLTTSSKQHLLSAGLQSQFLELIHSPYHHPCLPLLLPPSMFPSIRDFSNESVLHIRWPKDWSFSVSPSNEYSGLICFRIDWFDPAIQGTLKSLLQHHSWKASILWRSAFLMVQLLHPYVTTGKDEDATNCWRHKASRSHF